MRRRSGSKRLAQKAHFQKRLVERVGIMLDSAALSIIIDNIKEGRAVHLYDQSNRVKIKGVKYSDLWLVVVYDRLRKSLVTVLPHDSEFYSILKQELSQKGNGFLL